jgi:PAS domain S-box-containing protein
MDPASAGLSAAYQEQICELELNLTRLREQFHTLKTQSAALSVSEADYRDLFEYAPVGFIVHDQTGMILKANQAAAKMLGLGRRGQRKPSFTQFLSTADFSLWLHHMRRCSSALRASTELMVHPAQGEPFAVQLATVACPLPLGRPAVEFRSTLSDVRAHRAAEAALAHAHQDYERLIDSIEGIVWEADARTLDITYVSGYAERLLGYPLAEWRRPGFWRDRIYIDDRERISNQLSRAIEARTELRTDYRVITADRRMLSLHDNIAVIERDGKLKLLGVAVDVTDRLRAEEALRESHRLLEQRVAERTLELRQSVADLEAFSYSLSHDMRAPLRAMQGYAALLKPLLADKTSPQAEEFLTRIMTSAERLDALVQDVLQYSRVARISPLLQRIELATLMDNIVHDYPSLRAPRVQIEVKQPLLPVIGHDAFVSQALSNLMTNAVKFVPQDRRPHVRVWTEPFADQAGALDWVRIWVEDNGLGIAPEDQRRIFRIFERIHSVQEFPGTGIGLAIVQRAVERMGGNVGVQSTVGEGSRFWITLPAAASA